jgi:hypothetical protein
MISIGEIARLAAEEARKEQNRLDGGIGGVGRAKPSLTAPTKEKVSEFIQFTCLLTRN